MTLLLDRIKRLRPYLTAMQAESLCQSLDADANDSDILEQRLTLSAAKIHPSSALLDYLVRSGQDDSITLRKFHKLLIRVIELVEQTDNIEIAKKFIDSFVASHEDD